MEEKKKKVVIIGGGFGGLNTASCLSSSRHEVFLIDRVNHHLFQPLLYQVATAGLSPADITAPIRQVLKRQKNTTVLMDNVESIDPARGVVTLANEGEVYYDYLVVAVGVETSYFGNDEWRRWAHGLKSLRDALRIRERMLMAFEKAETLTEETGVERYLTFVVIGGGPTGVEMSGAIAEIARKTMTRNFRRINPLLAKIYLVEGRDHILPTFSSGMSVKARARLEGMGVTVITGVKVTSVGKEGVRLGDRLIETENVIWAAGVKASPLLQTIGVPLDRMGRVIVEPDLSVPGRDNFFVIGDAASAGDGKGGTLPGLAPVAIQQGRYVANVIKDEIPKEKRKPFSYFDKGALAAIGNGVAIARIAGLEFNGFLAWFFWSFVHIMGIVLFKNRMAVFFNWVYSFFTGQRGARIIQSARKKDDER